MVSSYYVSVGSSVQITTRHGGGAGTHLHIKPWTRLASSTIGTHVNETSVRRFPLLSSWSPRGWLGRMEARICPRGQEPASRLGWMAVVPRGGCDPSQMVAWLSGRRGTCGPGVSRRAVIDHAAGPKPRCCLAPGRCPCGPNRTSAGHGLPARCFDGVHHPPTEGWVDPTAVQSTRAPLGTWGRCGRFMDVLEYRGQPCRISMLQPYGRGPVRHFPSRMPL